MDQENVQATLQLLNQIEEFYKHYWDEKNKLPYSLNLLDEVHPNENSHSRILVKLLKYKEDNHYPFLKSFFEFLKEDFNGLNIKNPKIKAEKERIDITIKDDDYAVIIENKIHYAQEQETQVDKYVNEIKKTYDIDKIFVIYLTRQGGNPSEGSLSKKTKEELKNRYTSVNYRNHILPWLKETVLPKCDKKNVILFGSIEQYIDHLKGLFKIRDNMKDMNDALKKDLENKFSINPKSSPDEKISIIKRVDNKVDVIKNYLKIIKTEYESEKSKASFNEKVVEWHNKFDKAFPEYYKIWAEATEEHWWLGVQLKVNDTLFLCGIGYDNINNQEGEYLFPFYGISCRGCTTKREDTIISFVKKIPDTIKNKTTTNWYFQNRANFDSVYEKFEKLLDRVKEIKGVGIIYKQVI